MHREPVARSGELRTSRYRYIIQSLLGRGGMGVVYRAVQETEQSRRTVALKLIAPGLSGDANFRRRFIRESRLAIELNHPNIIPVYDADEADGQLLLAMALVEGDDLGTVLRGEAPLEASRTLNILRQLASALDKAHSEGLVHRDVKPGNALLVATQAGEDEHVYLCDFGLTKRTSSRSGPTLTGAFVGTLDYAAPEQIQGRPVMSASDQYALGCILFECLTSVPPFVRETDLAMLHAHLSEPPPSVRERRPDLPPMIDAVIARAMAKDPTLRYPSCREMVADARAALIPSPRQVPVPAHERAVRPRPQSHRAGRVRSMILPLLLTLIAAVVLVALGLALGTALPS